GIADPPGADQRLLSFVVSDGSDIETVISGARLDHHRQDADLRNRFVEHRADGSSRIVMGTRIPGTDIRRHQGLRVHDNGSPAAGDDILEVNVDSPQNVEDTGQLADLSSVLAVASLILLRGHTLHEARVATREHL